MSTLDAAAKQSSGTVMPRIRHDVWLLEFAFWLLHGLAKSATDLPIVMGTLVDHVVHYCVSKQHQMHMMQGIANHHARLLATNQPVALSSQAPGSNDNITHSRMEFQITSLQRKQTQCWRHLCSSRGASLGSRCLPCAAARNCALHLLLLFELDGVSLWYIPRRPLCGCEHMGPAQARQPQLMPPGLLWHSTGVHVRQQIGTTLLQRH